jgi:hypothetical protein
MVADELVLPGNRILKFAGSDVRTKGLSTTPVISESDRRQTPSTEVPAKRLLPLTIKEVK